MDVYKNARLTPKGREAMVRAIVDGGLSKAQAARYFHTTSKTVAKWVRRFIVEALLGLDDRSSRPHTLPSQTPPSTCDAVEALRRECCNGNGPGWEYVHLAVDDHSRIAFSQINDSEKKGCTVAFLQAVIAYYASLGITISRVMMGNGGCYKSFAFRDACKHHGIKHLRSKPYTPQTNGKAERFNQTALNEWAYATAFETSEQRKADLPIWQHRYNWHRPHASLGKQSPNSRLGLTENQPAEASHLVYEGKIGSVMPGAVADLIVVDGDPIEDIALLTRQGQYMPFIMREGVFERNLLPGE